ncbi:DUF4372 domain-containing protein [Parafilimonas sp.]|uniref:DUF4372 domain-containing protein n=1 Tax=Parafilimonas sp. TaxID=1969739 RepID=UPI0039E703C5
MFSQISFLCNKSILQPAIDKTKANRYYKRLHFYEHFISMLYCVLSGCTSLRKIVSGLGIAEGKLNHLGIDYVPPRSTLSDGNKQRPADTFKAVYEHLYQKYKPSLSDSTVPKAYLTVLFFDERFNYIGTTEATPYKRVSQRGDNASPLVLANVRAPIIEEDHYYAFGLKIAAISSQKLGDPNEGYLDNRNLYNDKELFDDADLDWYDYGFRNYDAQIGRFTQLDPLTWDYPELTNYQYASNDPILNIDLDGLEGFNAAFTGIGTEANQLTDVVVTATVKKAATSAAGMLLYW